MPSQWVKTKKIANSVFFMLSFLSNRPFYRSSMRRVYHKSRFMYGQNHTNRAAHAIGHRAHRPRGEDTRQCSIHGIDFTSLAKRIPMHYTPIPSPETSKNLSCVAWISKPERLYHSGRDGAHPSPYLRECCAKRANREDRPQWCVFARDVLFSPCGCLRNVR